jgi:predicted ATPase
MLLEASKRTQVVVTTHSPQLIDCFTSAPEDVLVCEKGFDNETTLRRFERDEVQVWIEEFTLGDIWQRGALGGTRW